MDRLRAKSVQNLWSPCPSGQALHVVGVVYLEETYWEVGQGDRETTILTI